VRPSPFAGTWYPGDAGALAALVDRQLAAARTGPVAGSVVALVSPHAGLVYSGPVAAHGFGLLRGRCDLSVVLVGPSHHQAFDGSAVWEAGAFATPLGEVPVEAALAEQLAARPGVRAWREPHRQEHSLEMQLPFLQRLVAGLRIVPVLMGRQDRDAVEALAAALIAAAADAERETLLVASTDLSHYQPAERAARLDARVVECVQAFDPEELMQRLEAERGLACGGGPLVAVMTAARALGANRARVLRRADSGDEGPRDKSRVVGYLSAALTAVAG
jgi:hypothetical protein